jgi:serine/threonine-protein kinase
VDRDRPGGSSRYELLVKIGSGGTASVYIARFTGPSDFSRLVAVKRPHPHLNHDPAAQKQIIAEARLASRLHHANVIAVNDVEATDEGLLLVMDYIEGVSLAELLAAGATAAHPVPVDVVIRVVLEAAAGLAAVHELEDERGRPLGVLHRDVSPQNILVGIDGTARLTDLGLAKRLASRLSGDAGNIAGKLAYLAPEILNGGVFGVQSDLFALGIVLWEALAGRRLFRGENDAETVEKLRLFEAPPPSEVRSGLDPCLDSVVLRALHKDPSQRWSSARDFAAAIEEAARSGARVASAAEVGSCVRALAGEGLSRRREMLRTFGGDGSFGMRSTQTAPAVQAPTPVQRTTLTLEPDEAARASIEPEIAVEAPPRQRRDLAAHSTRIGIAFALATLALVARLWLVGETRMPVDPPARAVEASLQAPVLIEAASLPQAVPVVEESPRPPAPAPSAPKRRSSNTAVIPRVAPTQADPGAVKASSRVHASQDDDLGF